MVADHCVFKAPLFKTLSAATEATPGRIEECVELLKNNELVAICPGGMREMFFSDENYTLLWNKRKGFAKIATLAKVPVIPVFTQNSRAMAKVFTIFKDWFRNFYERKRVSFRLYLGFYPVKLRAVIGKPIEFVENRTVEELVELTKKSMENLIHEHQKLPGSIIDGLKERFTSL